MCILSFRAPRMECVWRRSPSARAGAQKGSALSRLYLAYFSGSTSTPPMTLPGGASVPTGAYSKPNIATACLLGLASFFSKTNFPTLENSVLFLGGLGLGTKFVQIIASGPTAYSPRRSQVVSPSVPRLLPARDRQVPVPHLQHRLHCHVRSTDHLWGWEELERHLSQHRVRPEVQSLHLFRFC